jgi:D-glycero-D-manno-heptose 1,7-bisphosphate phosphatase
MVLLDRDGTINAERHYLSSREELELLPGAAEGIRSLRALGLPVAVVTNQSAIARGYFDVERLEWIHEGLREMLAAQGAEVDGFYVCPHAPDDACDCRKPSPALAVQAAADFEADLSRSFVVGDKPCDIDLGKRVGAVTVLVRTGYGEEFAKAGGAGADHCVADLREAAALIRDLIARDAESRGACAGAAVNP